MISDLRQENGVMHDPLSCRILTSQIRIHCNLSSILLVVSVNDFWSSPCSKELCMSSISVGAVVCQACEPPSTLFVLLGMDIFKICSVASRAPEMR